MGRVFQDEDYRKDVLIEVKEFITAMKLVSDKQRKRDGKQNEK